MGKDAENANSGDWGGKLGCLVVLMLYFGPFLFIASLMLLFVFSLVMQIFGIW